MEWTDASQGLTYSVSFGFGETLLWHYVQDDYGRIITTRKDQSLDEFWQRGCPFDTCPTYRSTVTQEVIDWLCRATKRPPPLWWKILTPLQVGLISAAASPMDATSLVETIVGQGANVNEEDGWGCTAVWWSSYYGDAATTVALLRAGADPHRLYPRPNVPGHTSLLHAAASRGRPAIIQLLLSTYHVNPNVVDDQGQTAFFMVKQQPYYQVFNSLEVTEALLAGGADPNHRSQSGETPLAYARREGLKDMEQRLLKAGARPL